MHKYMAHRSLKFITAAALIFFISMVVPAYADNAQDLKNSESAVTEKKQGLKKNSDIQVVMYMTDWCPYCKKAGEYIKSFGVNLIEYDIEKNESRKKEMKVLSGGSGMVPLIYIEGIIIRGYVPEEISEAVEKRKKQ
jgi:glutaredoxin